MWKFASASLARAGMVGQATRKPVAQFERPAAITLLAWASLSKQGYPYDSKNLNLIVVSMGIGKQPLDWP